MKVWEIADSQDHVTPLAVERTSVKEISPGAVLVVVRGMILAHTVPVARLTKPATVNQDMKALVADGRVIPEYLLVALWGLQSELLGGVETSTHGTKRLPTEVLLSLPIPIPPLAEQYQIVERVHHLLALSERLEASLVAAERDAERLMRAVLKEVIGT